MTERGTENPLTNNQNELENICGAWATLTPDEREKAVVTLTDQILTHHDFQPSALRVISNAYDAVRRRGHATEAIYMSTEHALRRLAEHFSPEEISATADNLEAQALISPQFTGLALGILRSLGK